MVKSNLDNIPSLVDGWTRSHPLRIHSTATATAAAAAASAATRQNITTDHFRIDCINLIWFNRDKTVRQVFIIVYLFIVATPTLDIVDGKCTREQASLEL